MPKHAFSQGGIATATPNEPCHPAPDADPEWTVYDVAETMEAWENFLSFGRREPDGGFVRGVIERSWERSAQMGVDAHGRGSTLIASPDDLDELRERNKELLESAADTLRSAAEVLGDAATMAVLTDCDGVVLDVGGDRRTIDAGHDIRLELGAAWGENVTGTNGIGTALMTGQLTHVHAAEHFAEGIKAWTCIGAPIRSPVDGSIIGVIDFSGPQDIFHRHTIALAVMSAHQIELALGERLSRERMALLETSLERACRLGVTNGVVILDRFGRIIHHDENAVSRWRGLCPTAPLRIGARLLEFGGGLADGPLNARLPEELREQNVEPLTVNGEIRGAMLILRPKRAAPASPPRTQIAQKPEVKAVRELIVGQSAELLKAIEMAERAALGRTAILLEGETGVGKELFAHLIHAIGQQSGREPFVTFNCGAVSKELIGAELFGHAPGAFTGVTREGRPGRFEVADGGTLSLDEIGELPLEVQPYLLRILEERRIYRIGESKPRPVDVRLIASTNRNLRCEVAEGRFRKDLYFRIGVLKITLPPLRAREGDVEFLIDHFNRLFSANYGLEALRFEPSVLDFLNAYDWPGNVRELRNLVESLALMAPERTIGFDDLPEDILEAPVAAQYRIDAGDEGEIAPLGAEDITRLDEAERRVIEQAIAASGGNVSLAAERLGVSLSTLYRKMHQYKASG